jgi:hypothetical protein
MLASLPLAESTSPPARCASERPSDVHQHAGFGDAGTESRSPLAGVCTSCGRKAHAASNNNMTVLVGHTVGSRIIRMSTNGFADDSSTLAQAGSGSDPAELSPASSATLTLSRPGVRIGERGSVTGHAVLIRSTGQRRYSYASHGLRFDIRRATESTRE